MTLAQSQAAFMAQVLDETAPLPPGWSARHVAGMAVYRNNYRTALVEAMRATYERTARWVGEAAFERAAAHHLILHPPASWTLDVIGEGFAETVAALFAHDPEVPELAALEWAMHRAFMAADPVPLDGPGLAHATAAFAERDWAEMRLAFVPGTAVIAAAHDLTLLWRALASERGEVADYTRAEPAAWVVWRDGLEPVFRQTDSTAGEALALALAGGTYGAVCGLLVDRLGAEAGVARAGTVLGEWIGSAMLAAVTR